MYKCFNCGFCFLDPDFNGYDEPAYCPECGSTNWSAAEFEINEGRALRRKTDFKKAIRKKRIINGYGWDYYSNIHQYSKNKIHCSCPLCRSKTSKKKARKSVGHGGKNWKLSDRKRIEEMQDDLQEQTERKIQCAGLQ